jgi:predicted HicB family RNase H-like nuclease
MAASKSQAKATKAWDAENMGSITIRFRKTMIKQIQEAADREGITRDQWLKEKIKKALEES